MTIDTLIMSYRREEDFSREAELNYLYTSKLVQELDSQYQSRQIVSNKRCKRVERQQKKAESMREKQENEEKARESIDVLLRP